MFSRRAIMGGFGAAALAELAAPALGAVRQTVRPSALPPRLKAGDVAGLIAPASSDDDPAHLDYAKAMIAGMGLVPKPGAHVADQYGYLSGTDQARADDINAMFADPQVRAIFVVRGGWGSGRILPLLDWDVIRANPKLLIGFSDTTALHLAFAARAGFATIHAPNAGNIWDETSWDSFWRMAFAGEAPLLGGGQGVTLRPGKARGRLLGGNLTVLSTLMGTPWLPDFDGAILFLEDVGEAEYRIDRMMNQLALAGILGRPAGVVVGQCTNCSAGVPDYSGFTVPEIFAHYLLPLGVPVFTGANIGHVSDQLSLPSGAPVEMDADAGTIRLLRPIVE